MLYDYTGVTVESVASETDAALAKADSLLAAAAAAAPSFESTLLPLELAGAAVAVGYGRGAFLAQVHTDSAVRDAGQEAEERISKWRVGVPFREDIYRAVRAFAETDEATALEGERRRLLDFWLRDFRRAGQELDPAQRAELESLRNRLVELEVAFQRNVNEYQDQIDVTREQLAGLPDDYVDRLSPGSRDGTYRVSLDYPELNPFLEQARDRTLREQLFRKHWSRSVDKNRPLLAEALRLRQRIAELLGHPTWAHYGMELKMASDPQRVADFYAELTPAIAAATEGEVATLASAMNADGPDGQLEVWDWRYYDDQARRALGIDQSKVSEYLPLEAVMDGLFEITGEVLGLSYRPVADTQAWHDSVRLYEILNADGELIAHFYADLFPRGGKFGHAAAYQLVVGHRRTDGEYEKPVSAIVANFTPPSGDRPSLLTHREVETLFHEFGHILHMSLTRAEFARFSGAETEWDFVEAPSQIMQHWIWNASVLRRFARHYRTGEPMPPELASQLVGARMLNVGIRTATQAFYGALDLGLHAGDASPDLDDVLRSTYAVTRMPYPEGTFMLSGFAHVMGGYDAGYYGYMWSEVIGDDMFGRFAAEGVLSPSVGADYRREILEPNGSRSADDMVRAFLGREPSNEAFLRLRGMLPRD
ncbi:MAG: M3 family metallopeptidase [Chloroflexota bacterium]